MGGQTVPVGIPRSSPTMRTLNHLHHLRQPNNNDSSQADSQPSLLRIPCGHCRCEHSTRTAAAVCFPPCLSSHSGGAVHSSAKMLVRPLERAGHTCATAANREIAVRAVADDMSKSQMDTTHVSFEAILMDFEMPVLNGPDATKKIRKMCHNAIIFGVVVSAFDLKCRFSL